MVKTPKILKATKPSCGRKIMVKLPEEVLLAKQIMKVIGKRNPYVVMQAVLIVIKTTELIVENIKEREKNT